MGIEQLPHTRQTILDVIKRQGPLTIAALAEHLQMSAEAVRQQLVQSERDGWVERFQRPGQRAAGRPQSEYRLTAAGEELFGKRYSELTVEVLDAVAQQLGPEALTNILAELTETRVRQWEPRLRGLNLRERLEALREIYAEDDPFTDVEEDGQGLRLVERDCPFHQVAMRRPLLCSVTVSVLTRLLGVQVVREERFQNGDGRCAFRVLPDRPVELTGFAPER